MPVPARLIVVHKHPTSARTRFLRYSDGIVAPTPFPKLSQVLDEAEARADAAVLAHPALLVNPVAGRLGLTAADFCVESEFLSYVDTSEGASPVYLARLKTMDPPFDAAAKIDARFIAIDQARDMTPTDLELLRRAYICVME